MDKEHIKQQLIDILCKEFQVVWLIKLEDMTMRIFSADKKKSIPDSVDTVLLMQNYDKARIWYIENYVVEHSRARLLQQTQIEFVLSKLENDESFFVEYGRINDGKINFNQLYYDKIVDPDSNEIAYIVLGFRDVDLTKKAVIDDLTGLLTRQAFFDKAEEMLHDNPKETFDLVLSDIVDFKKVNETYGATVADEILKWEGNYLLTLMKDNILIGRYGGDQMAIFGTRDSIMQSTSRQSMIEFYNAEKDNKLPSIKIKFGIYLDVSRDGSIITACDKAHMALNSIKHHYNKDMAYYNDEIRNQLDKQRRIEESMHESLKNGDFKVYYQPKHDAKTGKLAGAEALVRWIHPEYGFMSPADFIPLFEQNGFIVENDGYVWTRTCENLRRWEDRGIKTVPISVNGSKITMKQENIVGSIKESIERYNLSPSQLHVEITETLMVDINSETIDKLNALRDMGIKIELDDFGSGYSSLNVLSALPIDVVKLDMSFMQQFGDEKRKKVLIACINLAKDLGYDTVSEGVEYKEQQELLSQLGVDIIQGYFYSKPLPENEFEIYMMQNI